jgi:hypothetical protein
MGIADGIELDVDGQRQAEGSSQIQLRLRTGTYMSKEKGGMKHAAKFGDKRKANHGREQDHR